MDQVQRTIRLASRRYLWVEGAAQVGLAISIATAGLIVLLVLGTNIFEWYWPALLLVASLSVGVYRLRQRVLSQYRIAQVIDRKLALSDSLSTAQYLSEHPLTENEEAMRFQLLQAEELAKSVRVEMAFPFQAHRVWAIAGALAAVSFGLVAVRYMVTNSLNLHPPLVSFHFTPVVERVERALGRKTEESPTQLAHDHDVTTRADSSGSQQPDQASLPPQGPGLENEGAKATNGDPSSSLNQGEKTKEDGRMDAGGRDSLSPKGQAGDKAPGENSSSSKPQPGNQTKEQPGKDGKSSEGLINRMKDALSSLAAKMQPNQNQQRQQGQANNDKSAQEKAAGQQQASSNNKNQQGSQQQDGKGQQSDQNQTAEGQGQGQTAEKAESAQGQSSDQSPQKGADAHSGVGRQDGDKGIKDAEQLKAMGKLADLIGKRSAQLTGEMTVETSSGKQQLRAQYSQKMGDHSDSGGEINRNEVPPMFQRYVREYMDEVRKTDKSNQ
ncbi:MAG: proline-rich domain-containing protein [Bryobacteraceae bacterium]